MNKIINRKKTSNIPPLLENGIFVTNFENKADIFNDLFLKQCSEIDNGSKLPTFRAKRMKALETVNINSAKVLQIIRSLDCNKAHGWDDISIAMLKICDYAVLPPLCLIYMRCLETGSYPQTWKMANVLPVHKKESRQDKTNDRPISLLPTCGKIFEKLTFDTIYEHLCINNLLTPNQSGFRPGGSTINQLISITHSIYTAFEEFPSRETRAVFLDISKAFDKVWQDGLLFKLKSNGITGSLIGLIRAFLTDQCQCAVLNRKCSDWKLVTAGVPQGSVLGPLFFLIYINDLVDDLSSEAKLFADDTSLFTTVYDEAVAADQLDCDLSIISDWTYQWKMQFNLDKNKQAMQVIFSCKKYKPTHPSLFFNQSEVATKDEHTHLGMILDSKLNFNSHVREAIIKARRGIGIIRFPNFQICLKRCP